MKQGEIWRINLDPAVGGEMKKSRPALIINIDGLGRLPLRVIVPITDWKEHYNQYPWMVKIESDNQNGLRKTSSIDCFQIRSVSIDRFAERMGAVSPETIEEVQEAIVRVIGVD
jgi:mRNA interferase MazF